MKITQERFEQICNNVVEEYVDNKNVDFATKREFCEVILNLLNKKDERFQEMSMAAGNVFKSAMEFINKVYKI